MLKEDSLHKGLSPVVPFAVISYSNKYSHCTTWRWFRNSGLSLNKQSTHTRSGVKSWVQKLLVYDTLFSRRLR